MNIFLLVILLFFMFLPLGATYLESEIWGQVASGQYKVGYKHLETYDYSRTYPNGDSAIGYRPMQVSIWYPASVENEKVMEFIDYQYIAQLESDFDYGQSKEDFIQALKARYLQAGVKEDNFAKVFFRKTLAVENAQEINQEFPVVIYSPGGNEIASENFIMCELLASHGFLVISCPSAGFSERQVEFDKIGLRTCVNDIRYLYGYLNKLENAKSDEVLLIGFCLGAFANVVFAQENMAVKGIIGLHSEYTNPQSLIKHQQDIRPEFAVRDLKYLELDGPFLANRTSDFFDKLIYSDRYQIRFKGIPHNAFTSQYVLQAHCFTEKQILNRKDRDLAYELSLKLVLAFCKELVKKQESFLEMKDIILNDDKLADDFLLVNRWEKGQQLPPSKKDFLTMLTQDINQARQVLLQAKDHSVDLAYFKERDINIFAYRNLQAGNTEVAFNIFQLLTDYFPDSWNAWDSLGEAYNILGNKQKAIESYQKALELKGQDERIQEIIRKLEK